MPASVVGCMVGFQCAAVVDISESLALRRFLLIRIFPSTGG